MSPLCKCSTKAIKKRLLKHRQKLISYNTKKREFIPFFFVYDGYTIHGGIAMEKEANVTIIATQMERLVHHLESMRIADYMELLERPAKLILINFVAGLARGLGIAIGATLIFALMLEFLRQLILLHIPGIGGIIADIVHIVEAKNGKF
jgi:hypothetical protein